MARFAAGLAALALVVAPAAAHASGAGNWDRSQQRSVVHAGVMKRTPGSGFAGARRLSAQQLRHAVAALAKHSGGAAVPVPAGRVTVAGFDRVLVRQLGLGGLANDVQAEAR